MGITAEKQHGRTYTPPELADFLSAQLCRVLSKEKAEPISILDPACGDGELLLALTDALFSNGYRQIFIFGVDREAEAIILAR